MANSAFCLGQTNLAISNTVLVKLVLFVIVLADCGLAGDFNPSSAESIRRYIALYEQRNQEARRNAAAVDPFKLSSNGADNQNVPSIPDMYGPYDRWLAVANNRPANTGRFAWFQGGQPEVVANDDLLEEPEIAAQVYTPVDDRPNIGKDMQPVKIPKLTTVNDDLEYLNEQKKSEVSSPSKEQKIRFNSLSDSQVTVDEIGKRDTLGDIYFVVIVAGCSTVAIFGVIAAGYCFYRFQRNNKAAAEVDYPAYGVTGPNKEHATSPSGDRRLAQSAQMYHYQHQKQQMIAVEKATTIRNTSASDVDSEEENEEGDYTVYECPGLAPTGEMEVKNPLFHDDTTPMSPPVTAKESVKKP